MPVEQWKTIYDQEGPRRHRAKAALVIFEQIESPDTEKARQKLAEWQG